MTNEDDRELFRLVALIDLRKRIRRELVKPFRKGLKEIDALLRELEERRARELQAEREIEHRPNG